MLQKLMLFILATYIIILSSCAFAILPAVAEQGFDAEDHPYYTPDEPNLTKLSKEKELKIDISRSDENDKIPVNIKLGYSPKKNIGILIDHYNSGNSFTTFDSNFRKWNYHMTKIAGGVYYNFQNEKHKAITSKNPNLPVGWLFDIYAGYGLGKNKNKYTEGGESELTIQKVFLQAGIHYHHQLLGISFINRLSNVHFLNGRFYGKADLHQINGFSYISNNNNFTTIETSIKFSIGTERIQLYTGFIGNNLNEEDSFPYRRSKGYLGILMNLSEIWKKIKK